MNHGQPSLFLRQAKGIFRFTGAQKTFLRGLGQQLEPALKVGKGGLTPAFFAELERKLHASELVKLRFLGSDRDERANFCALIAETGQCAWIGAVGHTALFFLSAQR
ncbi:MAG: YhbY family RNA-binding protein [Opitutaceae bacterium]|jgi:RNA-binding protein